MSPSRPRGASIDAEWDVSEALDYMTNFDRSTRNRITRTLNFWSIRLEAEAKSRAPVWRGLLQRSIHGTVKLLANELMMRLEATVYYAGVVHDGIPPDYHKVFISWNKSGVEGRKLKRWAEQHGIDTSKRPGLWVKREPHPFMQDTIDKNLSAVISSLRQAVGIE